MGVLNANRIVEQFQRGLYNRKPTSYVISVDGELIRYKGMVSSNMTRHDAEEAVAQTSYTYLVHAVLTIEKYMGRKAREVVVFMDGARVANKTTSRPECSLDVSLIRKTFTRLCAEHGYRVHALTHGESELQMYLKRDRSVDLNILFTRDSDMIPICYDHMPSYYTGTASVHYDDLQRRGLVPTTTTTTDTAQSDAAHDDVDDNNDDDDDDDTTFGVQCQGGGGDYTNCAGIVDLNSTYGDGVTVVDSCAWFVCGSSCKPMQVIGFDACALRTGYSDVVFRTFAAMCGTDFTIPMLTPSMFTGFFSAADENEKRLINALTEPIKVVASIVYLGLKGGGVLKRSGGKTIGKGDDRERHQRVDVSAVTEMVSMYYAYVRSGVMAGKRMPKFDSVNAVKRLVHSMRVGVDDRSGADSSDRLVKRQLINWANNVPLVQCLQNLQTHLDDPVVPVSIPFVHFMADADSVLQALYDRRQIDRKEAGGEEERRDDSPSPACLQTREAADRYGRDPMIGGGAVSRPRLASTKRRCDSQSDESKTKRCRLKETTVHCTSTTTCGLVMTFSDSGSEEDDCLNATAVTTSDDRPTLSRMSPLLPLQSILYDLDVY